MLSFLEHCAAPALCSSCDEVVCIDLMGRDVSCPVCGAETVCYDHSSLIRDADDPTHAPSIAWSLTDGGSFVLLAGNRYRRPRCGELTMAFDDVGCFD
jgi:predicted RNA-binding Zn-ribbon protein involved in translation (DUF1610 family)